MRGPNYRKVKPFKSITTVEIVDAIESLMFLYSKNRGVAFVHWPMPEQDLRQDCRRLIIDGLRFHSGAKGVCSIGEIPQPIKNQ